MRADSNGASILCVSVANLDVSDEREFFAAQATLLTILLELRWNFYESVVTIVLIR
jgi:hypothetical protein